MITSTNLHIAPIISGKKLICINAPSNLGLKKMDYSDSNGPGVRKMPDVFIEFKFCEQLDITEIITITPPQYEESVDKKSGVRNHSQIIQYTKKLSLAIGAAIEAGKFPIVIGGDCSILLASALALKRLGNYGLAHIDGHTDFAIGNKSSSTAGAAGMDLALVTGRGHSSLTNIEGLQPYFQGFNVGQFGNRCDDKEFNGDFYESAIYTMDLHVMRKEGIQSSADKFIKKLTDNSVMGFWIHIDVDVLNDQVMPAVDSRQPDGLQFEELRILVRQLFKSNRATGMQFTIYDPDLDKDGTAGIRLVNEFVKMLNKLTTSQQAAGNITP